MAEKKFELKSINPKSLAKVLAVNGLIIGLLVGIVIAAFGGLASQIAPGGRMFAVAFGVLSIIIFPIAYAIAGFVGGAIMAVIYNFVAKRVGGVKVVLK